MRLRFALAGEVLDYGAEVWRCEVRHKILSPHSKLNGANPMLKVWQLGLPAFGFAGVEFFHIPTSLF